MPRLFVAVWPPDEVLDAIAALPRADEPGVRWTRRDQWHVTLRFLGSAEIEAAVAALHTVVWPALPSDRHRPGPGGQPAGAIGDLPAGVRRRRAGGGGGRRDGKGGRATGPPAVHRAPDPGEAAGSGRVPSGGPPVRRLVPGTEVTLVESRPAEGGPDYVVVARFPLDGA